MPGAYSVDLRERVVAAANSGQWTEPQVAALFHVGEATVRRWKRQKRETGAVEPSPHGGGNPPKVDGEGLLVLSMIVQEKPDATAQEIRDAYVDVGGEGSRSAVVRALKRLGLTRKKSPSSPRSN